MDASEFEVRKAAVLAECEVAPAIFERVVPRLERFMEPFVAALGRRERAEHALTIVQGLLSDLSHKNVESIASGLVGSGCRCRASALNAEYASPVGTSEWDDGALRDERAADRSRAG